LVTPFTTEPVVLVTSSTVDPTVLVTSCTVDVVVSVTWSTTSVAESTVPVTVFDNSEPRPSEELVKLVLVGAVVAGTVVVCSCCCCCSTPTTSSRLPLPLVLSCACTAAITRQAAVITRTNTQCIVLTACQCVKCSMLRPGRKTLQTRSLDPRRDLTRTHRERKESSAWVGYFRLRGRSENGPMRRTTR
ncbi:hypothetical protein L914_17868, partial [Phytophthora nicotianae]